MKSTARVRLLRQPSQFLKASGNTSYGDSSALDRRLCDVEAAARNWIGGQSVITT